MTTDHRAPRLPSTTTRRLPILVLAALVLSACGRRPEPAAAPAGASATTYACPMHPTYTSDLQGDCPVCGMRLMPLEKGGSNTQAAADARWAIATRQPAAMLLRLPGKVAVDERRITHVHARTEGVIERVFVDVVGTDVARGQPLLDLSSPEILATEQEYLAALESQRALPPGAPAWSSDDARSLVEAARRRLLLWEVPAADIDELARTGKARRSITLRSPAAGVVTMREAFHHSRYVTPETELYTLVDVSRVFVLAQAFEQDAARLRIGMEAEVRVPGDPAGVRRAPVSWISPFVDPATRTVAVRVELDNPDGTLRPEGVVDVVLREDLGEQLVVPAEAVIDSGLTQRVFVQGEDGGLEPRTVIAGPRVEAGRVILEGLAEGEHVAASAAFLVDSESHLSEALSTGPVAATGTAP